MPTGNKISINRPPSEVFMWLDDSERAKQWLPNIVDIQPITSGGNYVGARAKHIYEENGRRFEMEEETLIYVPNQHVKIQGKTDGFELTAEYRLIPDAKGTILHFESTLRFHNIIMRLLSPLITRSANKQTEAALQRLKTLVEKG